MPEIAELKMASAMLTDQWVASEQPSLIFLGSRVIQPITLCAE